MSGKIFGYLNNALGLRLVEWHEDGLSVEVPSIYKYSFVIEGVLVEGVKVLLLEPREKSIELSVLVARAERLEITVGVSCVLVLDKMDSMMRRQLISKRRSFVVPDKQVYLPFLGTYLSERGLLPRKELVSLSPSAQLMVLHHLQKTSLEGVPFSIIANRLGYTQKTVSLIASELKELGICQYQQIDSKTKSLKFNPDNKRELWERVLPYLRSPIHKVLYLYPEDVREMELCNAYDNALAHYTDIIDVPQKSYAIDKRRVSINSFPMKSETNFMEAVRLELWKYNPWVLAEEGVVDPLSMYLCYLNDDNERVAGELSRLVDRVLW